MLERRLLEVARSAVLAVAALLSILGLPMVSNGDESPDETIALVRVASPLLSGIRGVALVSPIFPIERPGIPNIGPLPGAVITIKRANSHHEVTRVVADANGRFQIRLQPGVYRIVPLSPQGDQGPPWGTPQMVWVRHRAVTTVTVYYRAAIR